MFCLNRYLKQLTEGIVNTGNGFLNSRYPDFCRGAALFVKFTFRTSLGSFCFVDSVNKTTIKHVMYNRDVKVIIYTHIFFSVLSS